MQEQASGASGMEKTREEMTQQYDSIISVWERLRGDPEQPRQLAVSLKRDVQDLVQDMQRAPELHMGHYVTCLLVVEHWLDDFLFPSTDSEPE